MTLKLTQIKYKDQTFQFTKELEFEVVEYIDKLLKRYCAIISKDLHLTIVQETKEKVLEELAIAFHTTHLNYVLEDDSKLTEKAKLFKEQLKSLYTVN